MNKVHQDYYNRALQASDPRYKRVFEKMGYGTRDMRSASPETPVSEEDALKAAREEYQEVFDKRAYHGWSVEEIKEKIAAEKAKG